MDETFDPDRFICRIGERLVDEFKDAKAGTTPSTVGSAAERPVRDQLNKRANLGYWVRSSVARRGVATAEVALPRKWAFRHTDLVRLVLVIAAGNLASQRVAEKAGAECEGTLRQRLWLYGTAHDGRRAPEFSIAPHLVRAISLWINPLKTKNRNKNHRGEGLTPLRERITLPPPGANVPERVAMLLTGHKSRANLDRYNIIHEQELLDASERA